MQSPLQHFEPLPRRDENSFFFATPALRLRLDLTRDYIRSGETPVVIIGEVGAGKSTLLSQQLGRADHNWRVVRVPAVTSFSAKDVATFLNAELRLPTRMSPEQMLRELDRWLNRIAIRGQVAVIAVDDAHQFSDESLTYLLTLPDQMQQDNCRVLMTGEPSLRARVSALRAYSRSSSPGHVINIPSLDQREVACFVDMKLYHAGKEGRGPFSRTVIEDIARGSRGRPGSINAMANDLMNVDRKFSRWYRTSEQVRHIMHRLSAFRDIYQLRRRNRAKEAGNPRMRI